MALQGTLETFSVPEVLRLLSGTRKTGLLALSGDRGDGNVWLAEGRLAGARSDREPDGAVEAVLFDLLRYREGSFVFESDARFDGEAVDLDIDDALTAAETLLADWREIEAVVPSLSVRLSMAPALPKASVTVTGAQWELLVLVAGGADGNHLSHALGLGELDTSRRIKDLADAGLVEIDAVLDVAASTEPELSHTDLMEPSQAGDDLAYDLAGFVAQGQPDEPETDSPSPIDLEVDAHDAHASADAEPDIDDLEWDAGPEFHSDRRADEVEVEVELDEAGVEVADDDDVAEPAADAPAHDGDPDEFLSQLANLSPKAAAAIEATADTGETGGAHLPDGEADEEINRNLLLKFLSSTKN